MSEGGVEVKKYQKKKGRSFLQKAKKFGRQGQRGKGTEIDQDQYDYLVRVMERWRDGFEDDDEKKIFVENVFEQTVGEERTLCGNQLASRVIELLLPSADHKVINRLSEALSTDLRLVCVDPFMSHVLEKLLILRSFKSPDSVVEGGEGNEWSVKVCRFVINNLEDFCQDTYASHLLRTATQCMAGKRYLSDVHRRDQSNKRTEGYDSLTQAVVDPEDEDMNEVLDTLTSRLLGLETHLLTQEMCVHVIQVFMNVVGEKHPKMIRKVVKHLLSSIYNTETVDWEDVSTVRLLETLVETGINMEKVSKKIFNILDGKLVELAVEPTANFVIQRVMDNIKDKEKFSSLVTDLADKLETVLSSGCTGVLLSLVRAAVRLETSQSAVLTGVISTFHCQDHQDQMGTCVSHMVTRDTLTGGDQTFSVHLHGSLVLQQLLLFSKPIKIVRSLLSMPSGQLSNLLSDPRGCHVTDTFMTSKTVGEKSREGLVKALKGEIVGLSCSKHGSRTVDCLWKYSSLKMRQAMVEEMAGKMDTLASNKFGKFVAQNCMVAVFKRAKDDWKKLIEKGENTENLFSEILGEKEVKSIKRKIEVVNKSDSKPVIEQAVIVKAPKKEVTTIVDEWLKSGDEPVKKKKKKAKSYLDDL